MAPIGIPSRPRMPLSVFRVNGGALASARRQDVVSNKAEGESQKQAKIRRTDRWRDGPRGPDERAEVVAEDNDSGGTPKNRNAGIRRGRFSGGWG